MKKRSELGLVELKQIVPMLKLALIACVVLALIIGFALFFLKAKFMLFNLVMVL
jgi:hypothetical protein